jgi:DNA replication protein DnaC
VTDESDDFSDAELAARAGASNERARELGHYSSAKPASLSDVLGAAARAQAHWEASGLRADPEPQVRARQLREVVDRLPEARRRTSRAELEQQTHPKFLAVVSQWNWGDGNVILAGRTRVGKTTAAVHLVRRLCHEGARDGGQAFELAKSIRWVEFRELVALAREYRPGSGTADEVISCQHARLLILDDLGGTGDRAGRESVERILQFRLNRAWPTITTTGIPPTDLDGLFGERFVARLLERAADKGTIVECFE